MLFRSPPRPPTRGAPPPLDPPMYGLVTPQYDDCVQDGLATTQDGLATTQDGLIATQDGLVTPPLWGLCADLFKKRTKSLKNESYSRFFHQGVQIGCKSRKTGFYVFCLFTSLYGRFRLSRASQTIDIEKIYRLVSKILNFMPCGTVLGRFCVQCENFVGSASKIY